MKVPMMRVPFLILAATLPCVAVSQGADTLFVDLDAVEVTATRAAESAATAPLAIAIEAREPIEMATDVGASLESSLRHLPGLWVSDRQNVALGERLSIRGMGGRAGFGVRGVQVVLDGIPLTMPDGQSALLIVDPALIRRAEVIRGPASTLWGNASGGVLALSTLPTESQFSSGRVLGGSHGFFRAEGEAALPLGAHQGGLALSHVRREGFRAHSAFELTRGRGFARIDLGHGARLTTIGAFEWAPEQQHPGALTADQLADDPRQAQQNFVTQAAGKDSRQGQVGVGLEAPLTIGQLTASVFGVLRTMENPLPFAIIELDRAAVGTRAALERQDGPLHWTIGFDSGLQRDNRQNYGNQGGDRGDLRLDQTETVRSLGAFARTSATFGYLTASLGLRHDRTSFSADDHLEDQDGSRVLSAWSPSAGLSYRLGRALVFASASTSFETPTTTELVNRPDGAAGFNPEIQPQRTRGAEVGFRGTDGSGRVFYDLALFRLNVRDQLTPFVGEDGRTYYQNAEATRHDGAEALLEWQTTPWLRVGATYAWSRFIFTAGGEDLRGNRLPGVPEHRLTARAKLTHNDLFARLSLLSAGPAWADDANTARADGFASLDLTVGHAGLPAAGGLVVPFVQVQNLFDARYAGSVALNAAGGRYFEPAAGRAVHLGVSVRFTP